ncbi:unnamed protein product [Spirodela intermedia]|uniref:Uncharacterized protein n=1 Tax=Spirodela intermedia TaxID=51605 RepID=A0A7I8IVK3_SPIIN|nr:unnamed protein product [Spirodela intermedia]CAA6661849.1 unnamed protein product [Spirodela intermedia]
MTRISFSVSDSFSVSSRDTERRGGLSNEQRDAQKPNHSPASPLRHPIA